MTGAGTKGYAPGVTDQNVRWIDQPTHLTTDRDGYREVSSAGTLLVFRTWLLCSMEPEAGRLMPRTGGFRKLRWAAKGKGKRGGARVIYLYVPARETVYMILAYGKDAVDDLTEAQRIELSALAQTIKRGVPR